MNPYIELVKKWLADNDSVSLGELKANKAAARDAYWAAAAGAAVRDAYWAAAEAAYLADLAADAAAVWDTDKAEHYKQKAIKAIAEYEELTK